MVASITNENELYSLQRKIKKWYSQEEPSQQKNIFIKISLIILIYFKNIIYIKTN